MASIKEELRIGQVLDAGEELANEVVQAILKYRATVGCLPETIAMVFEEASANPDFDPDVRAKVTPRRMDREKVRPRAPSVRINGDLTVPK